MSTASDLRADASTSLSNGNVSTAFDQLKRAAAIAMLASEWAEALTCYQALQGLIATFGSTTKQSGNVQTRIEWSGESLELIVARLQTKVNFASFAASGTVEVPYEYVRPWGER